MRAISISEPGGPDVLTAVDRPVPDPGPGEVRIAVRAAGVNRPDVLQRQGHYPPPPGASDLPGLEVAGVVEAAGAEVTEFSPGDRVCALLPGGGYAEAATVHQATVLPLPDALSFEEGAGLPETLLTVFANVFETGKAQAGEVLFVHGATSGIGTMAASLARAFGLVPFGTARTEEKCKAAVALGYEACFPYPEDNWAHAMGERGGADIVLDMVGGDYIARNLSFLKPGGRHLSIAFLGGPKAEIPIFPIMQKRLVLTGSTLRSRSADEKAALVAAVRERVWPRVAQGAIRPVIHRTFALEEAAEAHRALEEGDHVGKIILRL